MSYFNYQWSYSIRLGRLQNHWTIYSWFDVWIFFSYILKVLQVLDDSIQNNRYGCCCVGRNIVDDDTRRTGRRIAASGVVVASRCNSVWMTSPNITAVIFGWIGLCCCCSCCGIVLLPVLLLVAFSLPDCCCGTSGVLLYRTDDHSVLLLLLMLTSNSSCSNPSESCL